MFSKAHRLSTSEFSLVIETGREIRSPFFTLKHIPADVFKFSPTAPKKLFRTAVLRNRIRRRIYAAVRAVCSKKAVKPALVVLVAKKEGMDVVGERLIDIIEKLFVQARLIA